MYVPASFREADSQKLQEFMDRHSFATLVSQNGEELFASHLPLLFEAAPGATGVLSGHMARANPQWKAAADAKVLAIFNGPHAYISPTWYESANVVPTWNYVTVHVYGTLRLMNDRRRLEALIARMVDKYEAAFPNPWQLKTQDESFLSRMLDAVVGFEIEIERIEGKWKLGQNHSDERRNRVAEHLRETTDSDSLEIADLMALSAKAHFEA